MKVCKCGCGNPVKRKRVFVNKEHQLAWMAAGGARELNALLPEAARARGGRRGGAAAVRSGRIIEVSRKGAAAVRAIARRMQYKGARSTK